MTDHSFGLMPDQPGEPPRKDPRGFIRLIAIIAGVFAIVATSIWVLSSGDPKPKARPLAVGPSTTIETRVSSTVSIPDPTLPSRPIHIPSTTTAASTATTAPGLTTTTVLGTPVPTTKSVSTGSSATTTAPPDANETAYLTGWALECARIWAYAPDGNMYDSDDPTSPITVDVCFESRDSIYMTSDTPNAALAEGRVDARDFAALSTVSGIICWIKPSTQTIVGCFDLSINRVVPKPAG